ncbi:hypothetical protein KAH55_05220 [bacterium]|nr:hypothetical protein [bacterium]
MKTTYRCIFILILLITTQAFSQMYQGSNSSGQSTDDYPRQLIDTPTANTLKAHVVAAEIRTFDNGGILLGMQVGITDHFMVCGSFGGENILGEGEILLYKTPGIGLRIQLREDYQGFPAIAIGFDSQGYDTYVDSLSRYGIKSRGAYVVASKNYSGLLGDFGLHGGLNYSLEKDDGDSDINIFMGTNFFFGKNREFMFHVEYDLAMNDNGSGSIGEGDGYLNTGIRWSFEPNIFPNQLCLELDFRNLLKNTGKTVAGPDITHNRILKLVFLGYF